jgi:hypothetical protein
MRWLIVLAVVLCSGITAGGRVHATVSVHFVEFDQGPPGTLGSVTFLGDSVGIGAGRFAPSLPDQLLAHGWGPVRFHAVDGGRTGYPPNWPDYFNAVPLIDEWQADGWDSDTWIVNLGTNDSGYCGADVACARAAIMKVVDAIGPGHRIWWVKITRFPLLRFQADAWNAALDQIDAERTDFWAWDWPTEMQSRPDVYASYDNTHLYPDGYRERSRVMAEAFTRDLAVARRVGGDVALPALLSAPMGVVPIDPVRAIDTRVDAPGRRAAGSTVTVHVGDLVPGATRAVAANVAMVDPAGPGYVTAHACGIAPPATATVNALARTRAAGAIVPVGTDRTLCVTTSVATDLIVDVQAAFVPAASPGATLLTPLMPPTRLVDTRVTGRAPVLTLPVPAGAAVAAVNITVTNAAAPGFVTAYPCDGGSPHVSNVNVGPGDTNAGAAFVRVGTGGAICVSSSVAADVVVDLAGTLRAGNGLAYVAVTPTRALDTRDGTGGWSPVHGSGQTLDLGVAPARAGAVSATLASVRPVGPSFLAAVPCGASASTSSLNAAGGDVVANGVTVGLTGGRVCITASSTTQTVLDVHGWWVPA